MVGKPCVSGAGGPDKFDSSGLVYHCLMETGVDVKRQTCAGYSENEDWARIDSMKDLQMGDILFFMGGDEADVQHAGIYIGDGQMIHASSAAGDIGAVAIASDYWQKHFVLARRVG